MSEAGEVAADGRRLPMGDAHHTRRRKREKAQKEAAKQQAADMCMSLMFGGVNMVLSKNDADCQKLIESGANVLPTLALSPQEVTAGKGVLIEFIETYYPGLLDLLPGWASIGIFVGSVYMARAETIAAIRAMKEAEKQGHVN